MKKITPIAHIPLLSCTDPNAIVLALMEHINHLQILAIVKFLFVPK